MNPWYKKWWIWALIGLILVVAFLVLSFLSQVNKISEEMRASQVDPGLFAGSLTKSGFSNPSSGVVLGVETTDDPYGGPVDAQVVVVEFSDFQCPYCRQMFPTVRKLMATYDQVKFIYRDFPISSIHPDAQLAAEAAQCANEQGSFWSYHDRLFINQEDFSRIALVDYAQQIGLDQYSFVRRLNSGKYTQEVLADLQDGVLAGVEGTPTFFINNVKYEGVLPLNVYKRLIVEELNRQ